MKPTRLSRPVTTSKIEQGKFYGLRGPILLCLFALVLWMNIGFIVPLTMGAIFATVLYKMMHWLERFKLRAAVRASLVTFVFVLGFLIPISVLIVLGVDAALTKVRLIQESNINVSGLAKDPSGVLDMFGLRAVVDHLMEISPVGEEQARVFLTRALGFAASGLGNILQRFATDIPAILFANIVMLFSMFFLLLDGGRAVAFVRENSVFGRTQTDRLFQAAQSLCFSVMAATLVSGAVQALLVGMACLVTGTPNVVLIVFACFLMSFLPVIGTSPVTITLAIAAFASGQTTSGIVFLVAIPIIGLSDNFVRPLVMKGGAEMHPLVAFVAAFGALDAIGFYGLFIGPVVAGLFFTLLPMVTKTYSRRAA